MSGLIASICFSDGPIGGGGGSGNGGNGSSNVPATQTVPDFWPVVPLIAVNHHPVFPKVIVDYRFFGSLTALMLSC